MHRLTGWVFVGVAVMLVVAMTGRAVQGHSAGWWEWPVIAAMAALMAFVGLALLLDDPPGWLLFVVLAGYALFIVAFGVFALVAPEAAVVSAGRGPRTPGAARVMGVVFLISGTLVGGASAFIVRQRR